MLLCGEFERAEVKMESLHTSVLLYSNKNREQVKSCGITHFFSTSVLAIEIAKLHFQMGKRIYIPCRSKLFTQISIY